MRDHQVTVMSYTNKRRTEKYLTFTNRSSIVKQLSHNGVDHLEPYLNVRSPPCSHVSRKWFGRQISKAEFCGGICLLFGITELCLMVLPSCDTLILFLRICCNAFSVNAKVCDVASSIMSAA